MMINDGTTYPDDYLQNKKVLLRLLLRRPYSNDEAKFFIDITCVAIFYGEASISITQCKIVQSELPLSEIDSYKDRNFWIEANEIIYIKEIE